MKPYHNLTCVGEKITIAGLGCRATPDTAMALLSSSDGFKNTITWKETGELEVQLAPGGLLGGSDLTNTYSFSFQVSNPAKTCRADLQTRPSVTLQEAATCAGGLSIASADLNITEATFEGTAAHVSSATPCDENTVTVTLRSSQLLRKSCMPAVTISGLKYSTTEADFYGLLPLARVYPETTDSVAKTALFITANISEQVRWNQSTGMLTFSLTDNLAPPPTTCLCSSSRILLGLCRMPQNKRPMRPLLRPT